MEHARKMVVVPYNDNEKNVSRIPSSAIVDIPNSESLPAKPLKKEKPKNNKQKSLDKISFIINSVLKLAKINGYNAQGQILVKDGNIIQNSNIINLLEYSMKPGKLLIGEEDFIHLLFKAKVEPEQIINANVRTKLLNLYSSTKKRQFSK